jgi:RNA polymerase sigma-70 factor (ECF subfamily)
VKQLNDRQQEAIRLKFQSGLSYKEIAEVMDITVNHVGVLLHNAIKTIREKLSNAIDGENAFQREVSQ